MSQNADPQTELLLRLLANNGSALMNVAPSPGGPPGGTSSDATFLPDPSILLGSLLLNSATATSLAPPPSSLLPLFLNAQYPGQQTEGQHVQQVPLDVAVASAPQPSFGCAPTTETNLKAATQHALKTANWATPVPGPSQLLALSDTSELVQPPPTPKLTDRDKFLILVKIVFKCLDRALAGVRRNNCRATTTSLRAALGRDEQNNVQQDLTRLRERTKAVLGECIRRSRSGDSNFVPLHEVAGNRLRRVVGDKLWFKINLYFEAYCKTKGIRRTGDAAASSFVSV